MRNSDTGSVDTVADDFVAVDLVAVDLVAVDLVAVDLVAADLVADEPAAFAVDFSATTDFFVAVDFLADPCFAGFLAASFTFSVPASEGAFFAVLRAVGARLDAI